MLKKKYPDYSCNNRKDSFTPVNMIGYKCYTCGNFDHISVICESQHLRGCCYVCYKNGHLSKICNA
jgi:hypothetical protein